MWRSISKTRASVSSGYPKTEAPSTLSRRNWKTDLYFLVRPSVHTNPEKMSTENGLGAFRKEPEEFENGAMRFSVDRKHFVNGAFQKLWRQDNQVICLSESPSNTNPKWQPKWWLPCWFRYNVDSTKTLLCACSRVHSSVSAPVIVVFSNSSGVVWTKNIWCVFRVKPPFSNSSGAVTWSSSVHPQCGKGPLELVNRRLIPSERFDPKIPHSWRSSPRICLFL